MYLDKRIGRQATRVRKEVIHMSDNKLVDAQYVMGALGVSRASAYRVIRALNHELEEAGVQTLRGKVSLAYLERRFFSIPSAEGKEAEDGVSQ